MKTQACGNCEAVAAIVRRDYPFAEMGIPVVLENIEVIECSHCGSVEPIIPNIDGLMVALAAALICNPRKLDGDEVKFLRKYIGKSSMEFARFLHVNHTHLSKIENNKLEIGPRLDKLVRLLVANMSLELATHVQDLIKMMPDIDDSSAEGIQSLQIDPATMDFHYALA
jgi:YgiT-type zinc finger domain-containing protein